MRCLVLSTKRLRSSRLGCGRRRRCDRELAVVTELTHLTHTVTVVVATSAHLTHPALLTHLSTVLIELAVVTAEITSVVVKGLSEGGATKTGAERHCDSSS